MRLTLKCRCGCIDFSYSGIDTYECTQCSSKTIVALIGPATLEVDQPATTDEFICGEDNLEEKVRGFLDAYLFSTGAYGYTLGLASSKDGAYIFEVTETSPRGALAVMPTFEEENGIYNTYHITNQYFDIVSTFDIRWTLAEYNECLGIKSKEVDEQ